MRKLLTITLAVLFTLSVISPAMAAFLKTPFPNPKVVFFREGHSEYFFQDENNKIYSMPADGFMTYIDGRILLPIRTLANALGISDDNIIWDGKNSTITIKGTRTLKLTLGNKIMMVDGVPKKMDMAPRVITLTSGRAMVVAQYVAEVLGYEADYSTVENCRTVFFWPKGNNMPDISVFSSFIKNNIPQICYSSNELKLVANTLRSKGHKVYVPPMSSHFNNYGCIVVVITREASNREQFKKDICEQTDLFMGKETGDWLRNTLGNLPDYSIKQKALGSTLLFSPKHINVHSNSNYNPDNGRLTGNDANGDIVIEFCDSLLGKELPYY